MSLEPAPPILALPPPPEELPPPHVPLMAAVVPVAGSLVLWAVTGSPVGLVFAALGPLILISGVIDGRWRRRREARRAERAYERRLTDLEELIDELHAAERASADSRAPAAWELAGPSAAPNRWRTMPGHPVPAAIGRCGVPSTLRLSPGPAGRETAVVQRLRERAELLPDAPLTVDLRLGLCVLGSGAAADAIARSVLIQAVCRLPPTATIVVSGAAEEWLAALPNPIRRVPRGEHASRILLDDGGSPVTIVRTTGSAPADCDAVVLLGATAGRVVRHPHLADGTAFAPDAISAVQALRLARGLAAAAPAGERGIPQHTSLRALLAETQAALPGIGSLRCPIGAGTAGTVEVDLVADGPHAVVGGTTGSGKSELLRAWVISLAARYPPDVVQFLLLDFKGGAAFADLAALPHTVGVLTDLEAAAVRRAVGSIRAELRRRERVLAATGARAIEAGGSGLARLVVVVDEFAALADSLPECHAVLGDVAARGRSLGVHLILCTQRPAGVIRDALLANAALRVCLRVTSDEDSKTVVGVPDAAHLRTPGRAVVALPGASPAPVQVAEADPALPAAIAGAAQPGGAAGGSAAVAHRPWLPELPAVLHPSSLPDGDGIVFALADRPDEQSQPPACWDPRRHGALLVLGAPGSGRSTALAAVAAGWGNGDAVWPRQDLPCVWDAVTSVAEELESETARSRLLLLDDVDAIFAAAGEYGPELADRLLRVLRSGPGRGVAVAMTASRLPPSLTPATALAGCRLLLRSASRDEHLLAGGAPGTYSAGAPPGRGELGGTLVQVALARRTVPAPPEDVHDLEPSSGLVAVTTRPAALESALRLPAGVRRLGGAELSVSVGNGAAVVGTPDEWQSRWSVLRQLSTTHPVLFDGCAPAELRSLLGRQELPPPCSGRARWLVVPGEAAVRVRLPGVPAGSAP